MKMKNVIKLFYATTAIMLLSACNSQVESEIVVEDYAYDVVAESTEVEATLLQHVEENDNTIDHTFAKSINDALPPFYFRVLGERRNDQRVRIGGVTISDNYGNFIQEIRFNVILLSANATEDNHYGLVFGDFDSSGYLGLSIRRFPGMARHNRAHFFWLWDSDLEQFVYDWKLSEDVTEDNIIDYSVTRRINDDMPPFTFRVLGRWIEQGTVENARPNIHVVQVIDNEGRIIQEFGRLNAHPPTWAGSFGLHFADYNFDGFLDMALFLCEGGSMGNSPHIYWLWDNDLGKFVYNQELSDLSLVTTIRVNDELQSLWSTWRDGGRGHGGISVEHIDDVFVDVSATTRYNFIMDNGELVTITTETDFITGTEDVTYETIIRKRLHEDMPEFIFVRNIGGIIECNDMPFPEPREVSITILDDVNNIIQYIPGLFQSDSHMRHSGIEFDDFNFDGYLDMRLMRWQDGAGGLLANEYIWLWDNSTSQFVLNEQLMQIEYASISTCLETQQVVTFNRGGSYYHILSHYEYQNGEFVLISRERALLD